MSKQAFVLLGLFLIGSASAGELEEKNKKVVREFYEMAFNAHKPTEAAKKYFGDRYIQHNPHVPNGAEAFYSYFEPYFKENPESRSEIKRVLGDGDLVMVHVHGKSKKGDRGRAVVDIFRVENGKIVEHWDVVQTVPESAANSNTMF
jgi:predicted SnoaL-like aldol condensation-catalyzing enzyme